MPPPPYCSGIVAPSRPSSPISRKIATSVVPLRNASSHARQQAVLRVGVRRLAHRALVVAELLVEEERVVPVEACLGFGHVGLLDARVLVAQPGTTAVTSISTLARSSISAVTSTAVMAMS